MSTETLNIVITANNKQAVAELGKTKQSVFNLKMELEKYQNAVFTEKDVYKISNYNSKIQGLEKQIKQLSNVGKEGFDEFGNAVEKTGSGFNNVLTPIRQLAYILPGIGIAGIFNLAFEGIGKLISGISDLGIAESKAQKETEALNQEIAKQEGNAAGEISHIQALISVATSHTASINDRKIAVKELQDKYPAYFKDLTTENALTKDLTTSTNELTSALLKRAEAAALSDRIQKNVEAKLNNQDKAKDLQKEINGLYAERNGILALAAKMTRGTQEGVNPLAEKAFTITQRITALEIERLKLNTEILDINGKNYEYQQRINGLTAESIKLDQTNKPDKKGIDEVALAWENWNKQLERYIQNGLKISGHQRKQETIVPGLDPVNGPAKANLTDNAFNQIQTEVSDRANQAAQSLKDYNDAAAQALQITNALAQPFTDLANAMLQGQDLGEALGNTFKKLAADIAAAAVKAAIFSTLLSFIPGVGPATGGVPGFGKLFAGFLGLGKGFADGGVSKGPKSGYLALLHGTEIISRPEQMANSLSTAMQIGAMSGGGNQAIVLDTRISGNDIWLSQRRTDFFRNLRT